MPDATILVNKIGRSGRPAAIVYVDPGVPTEALSGLIQKHLTRNADLLKKIGLKGCLSCISGMDIDIRHRYDIELRAKF